MKFYEDPSHPLRVYLQEESLGEMSKLILYLDNKYAPPETDYNKQDSTYELTSLLLYDEKLNSHYIVRGLLNIIMKEANAIGISCTNEVPSSNIELIYPKLDKDMLEGISLRNYQLEGIAAGLAYKRGVVQVHTGGGKTEMMIGVSRYLLDNSAMHILICVPTTNLLYQTYDRMKQRGIDESDISLLGDGNAVNPECRVLIATVQSAFKRLDSDDNYMDWLKSVGCLMMDEAHHSKCRTWSTVIDRVSPEYLLGFSAEPFHRDDNHIISDLMLRGLLGPVIHRVTIDFLVEHGYLSKPFVLAIDTNYQGNLYQVVDWSVVNKSGIVKNKLRNTAIRDIAKILVDKGKNPLILVQQIAHGQDIASKISELGYRVMMMTGGMSISEFRDGKLFDKYKDDDNIIISEFNEGKIDVLIGTSTLDEGVDIPSLSSVILAGGGKGRIKTIQKIGRSLRRKSGANTTFIIDFRDRFNVVTHAHFKRRKSLYDEMSMTLYYCDNIETISPLIDEIEVSRRAELGISPS